MDVLPEGLTAQQAAAFEHLRARFLNGLRQRWCEINSTTEPLEQAAALHRLAGAAGSYGFVGVGVAAQQVLQMVEASGSAIQTGEALLTLQRAIVQTGVTI